MNEIYVKRSIKNTVLKSKLMHVTIAEKSTFSILQNPATTKFSGF